MKEKNISYYQLRVSMVEPGPDPNAPDFRLPQADSEGDTEAGAGLISASHYSLKKKQLPLPLLASIVTAWNILLIMRTFPIKCVSPASPPPAPRPSIYELITQDLSQSVLQKCIWM